MDRLIEVYNEVAADIRRGRYTSNSGEDIVFGPITTERIQELPALSVDDRKYEDFPNPIVYVENSDFLNRAVHMHSPVWPHDLVILNPASDIKAGGGVRTGSKALEEIICRRSNLLQGLEMYADRNGYYDPKLSETEVIYSEGISVYRGPDYSPLPWTTEIDIITAAAPRRPDLTPDNKYTAESEDLMKRKIRAVFRVAIMKGKIKLVLPAWGCGAFYNPADEVARCFSEVLSEPEFYGAFQEVCFAILDDHNAKRADNPRGNYKPFLDVFGVKP